METDYIRRAAAIKACKSATDQYEPIYSDIAIECAVAKIRKLPAADVRPVVHGNWIAEADFLMDVVNRCSVCGEEFVLIDGTPADNNYNFCPCCGADMRPVDGDET